MPKYVIKQTGDKEFEMRKEYESWELEPDDAPEEKKQYCQECGAAYEVSYAGFYCSRHCFLKAQERERKILEEQEARAIKAEQEQKEIEATAVAYETCIVCGKRYSYHYLKEKDSLCCSNKCLTEYNSNKYKYDHGKYGKERMRKKRIDKIFESLEPLNDILLKIGLLLLKIVGGIISFFVCLILFDKVCKLIRYIF